MPKPALQTMILMGLMMAGARTVDALTANMLPITAKHFTNDLTLIGTMVALNRVGGFLIQPYVAWKSDGHRSADGRRRPFLLAAWPATLVFVGMLGALPFVVPAEFHRTASIIVLMFTINLGMQVALDVCYGSATPLYGDLFPPGTLGRAHAIRTLVTNAVMVGMMSIALPLADRMEFVPYLAAMFFLSISWTVTQRGIKEPIPPKVPPRGRYNPLRPLRELRDPHTRRAAGMASAVLVSGALTEMFHALFVTATLGLSIATLGWTATAGIIVSFLCPYPIGLMSDRLGPRTVLIVGFSLMLAVEAALVFWVNNFVSLCVAVVLYRVAHVVVRIPITQLIFQDTPAERRGAIFAGVQATRAVLAAGATIIAAYLTNLTGSYRTCYLLAGIVCLVGLAGAFRLVPASRSGAVAPLLT